MPTFKTRSSSRGNWTADNMLTATKLVLQEKYSLRQAALITGIPRTTLQDKIRNIKQAKEVQMTPQLGRFQCTFPVIYEKELVDYVLLLDKRLMPLSRNEFLKLAFDLAEKLKIPHRFNKVKKQAGKDFYYQFIERHPELSLRKPESTSLTRAVGFNKPQVQNFYLKLEQLILKYKIQPSRIFNCDETGVTNVHGNSMVLSKKGKRQVGKLTSAERGRNITILFCMSPTGMYMPPFFVFPRKRMNERLMVDAPTESIGVPQVNGWMNSEIFLIWIKDFVQRTSPTKESPILLILDGHCSHKDLAVIDYASKHNVHLLSLPPHSSHKLQPLDRTFMKPFKNAYGEECALWMRRNPGLRITDFQIASFVHKAFQKVCRLDIAENGFLSTGIYPFNSNNFTDEDFAPSLITDVSQTENQADSVHIADQSNTLESHLQELIPLPDASNRRLNVRKRRSERSEILTSEKYINILKRKVQEKIDLF